MKASVLALLAAGAASVSAKDYSTSTVYATSVYTITSCAPEVTDCPARMGSVTTDVISLYTTICPVTETESSYPTSTYAPVTSETPYTTSTIYSTVEYTILSCPPTVTNCPVGSKTSTILTSTTICPVTTTESAPMTSETPYTTSTIYTTTEYTITSCPATVTNCPVGSKTTETYSYTTYCPVSSIAVTTLAPPASKPAESSPATYAPVTSLPTATTVYVCPGSPYCPATTESKSYGTAAPSVTISKNSTATYVPVTGGAVTKKAGSVLMAVGLVAALL